MLSSGIRSIGPGYFRHVVFSDASWSIQSLDVDADIDRARKQDGGVLVMTDPDLSAFGERGGKLLLWHGWSDGAIPPQNTINYYNSVVARMGATVKDDVRLFMVPGAHHCGGGVDYLSVMEQWVEGGKPPERIIARRPLEGGVMRTRPLCPYPQIPTYSGKGNTDDAANFECVAPSLESGSTRK